MNNSLLDDFVEWFKRKNGDFEGFKLTTYKDGEPVFIGRGIEISLRDYLAERDKIIKILQRKSAKKILQEYPNFLEVLNLHPDIKEEYKSKICKLIQLKNKKGGNNVE